MSCAILLGKVGQTCFITGMIAFFSKPSIFNSLLKPDKALICSRVYAKIACGPLSIDPWCLSHSMILGKTIFHHLDNSFFWNVCFYWPLRSQNFFLSVVHFLSEYFFGTLMSCCLTYVMCNITRESRPNLFHHWNDCLFFKTFHFQQPIRTWKSPYKFPSNCQKSLWTPIKWFLMFVTLDDTRKNDVWSSWKQLFFEMFVSIDLLGPKEMILLFAQYLSKHLVDTVKLLPDICHVR